MASYIIVPISQNYYKEPSLFCPMIFMKVFIYILLGYLSLWDYLNVLLLKAPTNLSEEHEHKISMSQKSISEAREIFFKITTTLK
jgi:hypothetical protein